MITCSGSGFASSCTARSQSPAGSDGFACGGGWIDPAGQLFSERDELWVRFYLYVGEDNIPPQGNSDKGFYLYAPDLSDAQTPNIKIEYMKNGRKFGISSYGLPGSGFLAQNQGNDLALENGTWYLFEWHAKINTPGSSDGINEVWADPVTHSDPEPPTQTLRLRHTNLAWRRPDSNTGYDRLWLTTYHNNSPQCEAGSVPNYYKWDSIIVSGAPIGSIGPSPGPPLPPTLKAE